MKIRSSINDPVGVIDFAEPVALSDFDSWVTALCARYHESDELLRYFDEKQGLSNDIQKELIPLAKLCKYIAPCRPHSKLQYVHGSKQSYDAQILIDGLVAETLEVTLACDGHQEALAAEAMLAYGYAPLWSTIEYSGKKGNRIIPEPELKSLDSDEIVEECIAQVRKAVERKSSSAKYKDINLVVAFEDFRLGSVEHRALVTREFGSIKSCFNIIYFVGLNGNFFLQSDRAS